LSSLSLSNKDILDGAVLAGVGAFVDSVLGAVGTKEGALWSSSSSSSVSNMDLALVWACLFGTSSLLASNGLNKDSVLVGESSSEPNMADLAGFLANNWSSSEEMVGFLVVVSVAVTATSVFSLN